MNYTKSYPNLSAGELDPGLAARQDLSFYEKGLKAAKNILCRPKGGFEDRGGFVHVGKVRAELEAVSIPPGAVTVPSGTTTITTGPGGDPIIIVTDPVVPSGGGYVMQVDFGQAETIHLMDVFQFEVSGAAASEAWQVEYSDDAVSWTLWAGPWASDGEQSRRAGLEPGEAVSARYFRVYGLAAIAGRTFSAGEVRFWRESSTMSPVRLFGFSYDADVDYLMVQTDRNIEIYNDKSRVASVPVPHTAADLARVSREQDLDTLFLFHEDYAPLRVLRYGGDDEWDVPELELENIPREQFSGVTYTNGVNEVQEVLADRMTSGTDRFQLSYSGKETAGIVYDGDNSTTASNIQSALIALSNIGSGNVTVARTGVNVFSVTFTGDLAQAPQPLMGFKFVSGGDGDEVLQVSRITEGQKGGEPIMSTSRGWPACGALFGGRLILAGLKSRPSTTLASVIGDLFNFDIELEGDGALSFALNDGGKIRAVYPGRSLAFFTDEAEYWLTDRVLVKGEPINFARSSERGISASVPPLMVDDRLVFVALDGRSVRDFAYSDPQQSFVAPDVSRLSSHLVRNPADWAAVRTGDHGGADLVAMANETGGATIVGVMGDEEFLAFHNWETDGTFLSFGVEGRGSLYAAIEREIDGVTARYLEHYDEDELYDAASVFTDPGATLTGLDHLEGKSVELWLDGRPWPAQTVASGALTLPTAAGTVSEARVGLGFEVKAEILPPINAQTGGGLGKVSRIFEVRATLTDTGNLACRANGLDDEYVFDLRDMGDGAFAAVDDVLFTGTARVAGLMGTQRNASLTLHQTFRAPLQVLALDLDVREVSG